VKVAWLAEPGEKDYAAARSYLSLLVAPNELDALVAALPAAATGSWRAKDILRAARLPLIHRQDSSEVAEHFAHIEDELALSPVLLVVLRGERVLQIADGYHRTCAAYIAGEDSLVPGRLHFA
jgi:hypothetical protein